MGGFLQLAISARSAGSNQKPENEIIWNGYFEGNKIVKEIVQNTKSVITGTKGLLNVFIDGQIDPSVQWIFAKENIYFQRSDILLITPEIAISANDTFEKNGDIYQGQEFVSKSYPLWTWDPIHSFFSADYWNWFFFRNNLQYKEYNSIWINKTILDKKSMTGAS